MNFGAYLSNKSQQKRVSWYSHFVYTLHTHNLFFKLFLKTNPELLSVPNKNGYTCGHIAATKGSVSVLQELMKFDKKVITSAKILVKS